MCTISENTKRKTADRDLPCVKILQIMEDVNGKPVYVTPYQYMYVSDKVLTGGATLTPNSEGEHIYSSSVKMFSIENGFIHAYSGVPERDVLNHSLSFLCKYIGDSDIHMQKCVNDYTLKQIPGVKRNAKVLGIAVFLAVVPEGTEYIEGEDSKYYDSSYYRTINDKPRAPVYAAKQIRLVRPLEIFDSDNGYSDISESKYEKIFGNLNSEISGK